MAYKIELSETVARELDEKMRTERDVKVYRRLHYLDLKRRGYSQQQISDILGVSLGQLTNWSKVFLSQGLEGLCYLKYEGKRHSRLTPYVEEIRQHVKENSVSTLTALQHWIQEEFKIYVEQSWLSRWIKKNSIALIRRHA
jgi:putative transposase